MLNRNEPMPELSFNREAPKSKRHLLIEVIAHELTHTVESSLWDQAELHTPRWQKINDLLLPGWRDDVTDDATDKKKRVRKRKRDIVSDKMYARTSKNTIKLKK